LLKEEAVGDWRKGDGGRKRAVREGREEGEISRLTDFD